MLPFICEESVKMQPSAGSRQSFYASMGIKLIRMIIALFLLSNILQQATW
jgi:hypothetical protein